MEKCLNILYPVATVSFGGVETFIRHTALFHDPKKVKATYCFFKDGPLVEWMKRETTHDIRVCSFPVRLRNPISVLRAVFWLKKEAQASSCDLIHSSMAYAAIFGAIAAWLARVPHIWFQHGPVGGWMDQLAGILPSKAILFNSRYTQDCQLSVTLPFSPKLTHKVIHLGAMPVSAVEINDSTKLKLGMLCRFQKWKGIEIFIEAVSIARRKIGAEKIEATLWGDFIAGQEQEAYARSLESLCNQNSIQRLPFTANPEAAIQSLDVVVNSSITPEPFGLTIVEAMNAGVIPIAPHWGGPAEIIEDQTTGLLFEPLNADDLADKIIDLVLHPEKRAKLSIKAREMAMQKFSAPKTIARLEQFYETTLQA